MTKLKNKTKQNKTKQNKKQKRQKQTNKQKKKTGGGVLKINVHQCILLAVMLFSCQNTSISSLPLEKKKKKKKEEECKCK